MYLLLTLYTLIMLLTVLSHLILKIKSFMKFFKKGLEIFQNFHEIFKYFNFKVKYFIVHLYVQTTTTTSLTCCDSASQTAVKFDGYHRNTSVTTILSSYTDLWTTFVTFTAWIRSSTTSARILIESSCFSLHFAQSRLMLHNFTRLHHRFPATFTYCTSTRRDTHTDATAWL